jgi:hypothetical protein
MMNLIPAEQPHQNNSATPTIALYVTTFTTERITYPFTLLAPDKSGSTPSEPILSRYSSQTK